jgi:ABC-type sulfate transport system substrate-binding protein
VAKPSGEATETAEGAEATPLWPEGSIDTSLYPPIADQFTISDFGGWAQVKQDVFSDDGVYTQVIAEVKGG